MLTYADACNMKQDEAELWIVNLIRNARLDAKVCQYQHMCPHITISVYPPLHVSSYYYVCVLMLSHLSSYKYKCVLRWTRRSSSSLCVLILVQLSSHTRMCPHSSTSVLRWTQRSTSEGSPYPHHQSYYYYICVKLTTTIYVSSY